ncbi:toll/interleukin-1 receptor domain-containing protein [Streptomyces sp. SID9124]|uniref:TIR domain-containing protein n=1 Tax=Streptomyces sp. SID9124 TaxID=2706108 RepID=UPI0013E0B233|nr:toll/interleukin-1 receptor domain-containing protein [Streptomyces sp. SID9124]
MKVFLSWSGDRSKAMAEFLQNWLPDVIQAIDPWISSRNIPQGSRPLPSIADELASCNFGIVCVTPENRSSEWINFEAGALSKMLDDSVVVPLLLDIEKAQVTGPLSQFQMTLSTARDEVFKLVSDMNGRLGDMALAPDRLDRSFDQNWPSLMKELGSITLRRDPQKLQPEKERSVDDLLEEVLLLARRQERRLADVESSIQIIRSRGDGTITSNRRALAADRQEEAEKNNRREENRIMAHNITTWMSEYGAIGVRFGDDSVTVNLQWIPEAEDEYEKFREVVSSVANRIERTVTTQSKVRTYTHDWPF